MNKKKIVLIVVLLLMIVSTLGIYVYKSTQKPIQGTAEVTPL